MRHDYDLDIDQIHKIVYDMYERTGSVTLSGHVARQLFTGIPNREKALAADLERCRNALHTEMAKTAELKRERDFWKAAVEDPMLYYGVDDPPYRLDDE